MQTIKLNNGIEMPVLGYGVFQVSPEECERCVLDAISTGYRLIDTAQAYYNEEGVGNAVTRCGVPRNELFLTTKIWISNAGETNAARSIDESLRKLHTDYIDLLLIHQPFSDYPGTWRAMEKAVKDGKVRAIGLSNFYPDRFVDMAEYAEIKPAVNQLKTNVFSQQWEAEAEMNLYDTHIMAWAPLAQGNPELLTNPVLTAQQVAERKEKGLWNKKAESATKTTKEIVKSNVFTYFNLIFLVIALLLIGVGAFRDLTFLPIIIANTLIGIVQEIRSKKVLDDLSILNSPKTRVIRDGSKKEIPADELVLDDIVELSAGGQIPADAVVLNGQLNVNESLLTGSPLF